MNNLYWGAMKKKKNDFKGGQAFKPTDLVVTK